MNQENALKFAMSDAAIVAAVRLLQEASGYVLIVHRRTVEQMAELVPDALVMTVQELSNDMEKMEETRPIILTNFSDFIYFPYDNQQVENLEVVEAVYFTRYGKSLIIVPVPDVSIYSRPNMIFLNKSAQI
jgi:hypothetical protein